MTEDLADQTDDAAGRPTWFRKLTERRGGALPRHRATSRLSAYVYGNILVLAAVVVATTHTITDGTAALIVLATGATTYIAHVFAQLVGDASIPPESGRPDGATVRRTARHELRDALPIVSSAVWPAVVLALGYHDLFPTRLTQLVAGSIVVVRIASLQIVAQRVQGNPLGFRVVAAGLFTALVAAVIVVIKNFFLH
ncbi:hypothetical protein [Gordonia sp. NPDC003376]